MKKIILLLTLGSIITSTFANDIVIPTKKHSIATNSFWSNWYISAGIDYNAAYTANETLTDKNPFIFERGTIGIEASAGKWFTPSFGMRTSWSGLWQKHVVDTHHHHAHTSWTLHEDVMCNINHLIFGYDEHRFWSAIPYVGLGLRRDATYSYNTLSARIGLDNSFRLTTKWTCHLDISYAFSANTTSCTANSTSVGTEHWDKTLRISIGVAYHLGKTNWKRVPDVNALIEMHQQQREALQNALHELQKENEKLREKQSPE